MLLRGSGHPRSLGTAAGSSEPGRIVQEVGRNASYTVSYRTEQTCVDLCRVIFGGDGSYYVTAPYHPLNHALVGIYTINYAKETISAFSDGLELALLDDDEHRLKIAHHPDGFLQFSGSGIRSGRDAAGKPKGIGIMSWPLASPTWGPSFSLLFSDPVACGRIRNTAPDHVVFDEVGIMHMRRGITGLRLTGHYLPPHWREFVFRYPDGTYWVNIVHPNAQGVKRLRVILASPESDYAGLIGLEALPHSLQGVADGPAFMLSTSTGNLRRNDEGELLGDQLLCFYPQPDFSSASVSSLNYGLPAPPPKAPPGTTAVMPDVA
jgi:hypothetical protein